MHTRSAPADTVAREAESGSSATSGRLAKRSDFFPRTVPEWIWIPLSIFFATRALSAGFLTWAGNFQGATPRQAGDEPFEYFVFSPLPRDPGYLPLITNWDGQWYKYIATDGYATAADDPTAIANNAWNFPPLFPYLTKVVMETTGWQFAAAASVFSIVVGAAAMILIYRLTRPLGRFEATATVLLTCTFISSPLLQAAYSESLALLFLLAALTCIHRGAYAWALLPVLLLCFTRLISPAIAPVVVAHVFHKHRQDPRSVSRQELASAGALTFLSVAGVLVWPNIAAILRGGQHVDRASSMAGAYRGGWFGELASLAPSLVIVPTAVTLLVLVAAWRLWRRGAVVLATWAASYPIFLLVVTPPLTGILRYFLLAFPLAFLVIVGRGNPKWWRWTVLSAAVITLVLLQLWWVRYSFVIDLEAPRQIMP